MKFPAFLLALLSPLSALAQSAPVNVPVPVPVPAPAPGPEVARPLRLSFASTSAFGVSHAGFFNQLGSARLDYRFTSRFALGATLSYANLKGKSKRVHNVLPEVTLEYRIPLSGENFGIPLQLAAGFLPKNGPTLRLGAGLDFALSDSVSLYVIPLEPMVWVNRERPEVSLDASLGVRIAF